MKILGIDTTTKFMCLGLYDGARIYEYNLETGRNLSRLLAKTINRVLDTLGWRPKDIDYFACGQGPGSFTGVRVGMSFVKGMSWSLQKCVLGIPTLDILARNAGYNSAYVIPVIDAKRSLVYCAVYKNKNGRLSRITPYLLLKQEEFSKKINPSTSSLDSTRDDPERAKRVEGSLRIDTETLSSPPLRAGSSSGECIKPGSIILGDALTLYKGKIQNTSGPTLLDKDYWYPKAHNIIDLALERIRDKGFASAFSIKPIYLYPKECQVKLKI